MHKVPTNGYTLFIYIYNRIIRRRNIKSPHANVPCCITAVSRFKVAKFENHRQVTFRKRPFETGRTTGLRSLPSMSKFTARPH